GDVESAFSKASSVKTAASRSFSTSKMGRSLCCMDPDSPTGHPRPYSLLTSVPAPPILGECGMYENGGTRGSRGFPERPATLADWPPRAQRAPSGSLLSFRPLANLLERDVAVLARRILVALGLEQLQRLDEPAPGVGGLDHVVDVALLRRDIGVGELRAVFGDQPRPRLLRILRLLDLLLEDDVHRALRAHHRDLRGRPGEVHVPPDVLRIHHVVRAA